MAGWGGEDTGAEMGVKMDPGWGRDTGRGGRVEEWAQDGGGGGTPKRGGVVSGWVNIGGGWRGGGCKDEPRVGKRHWEGGGRVEEWAQDEKRGHFGGDGCKGGLRVGGDGHRDGGTTGWRWV